MVSLQDLLGMAQQAGGMVQQGAQQVGRAVSPIVSAAFDKRNAPATAAILSSLLGQGGPGITGAGQYAAEQQDKKTKALQELMTKGYQPATATTKGAFQTPSTIKDLIGEEWLAKYTPSFAGEKPDLGQPASGMQWVPSYKYDETLGSFVPSYEQKAVPKETVDPSQKAMTKLQSTTAIANLRKEFKADPMVKTFIETQNRYKNMMSASQNLGKAKNKVAIDQALINMYNKILDPSSVVRESEYARTASDLSALNKIKGAVQKMSTGGAGLTDEDRMALVEMGNRFYKTVASYVSDLADDYSTYATDLGADPTKVVPPTYRNMARDANRIVSDSDGIPVESFDGGKTWQKIKTK